ncbi:MAG: helix-turn-helix domain-containing protein, partial [Kiritimatiellia bacterium]|nr:helix-turn-helix domain-containing protein [Kiritimatiellia bacterium]
HCREQAGRERHDLQGDCESDQPGKPLNQCQPVIQSSCGQEKAHDFISWVERRIMEVCHVSSRSTPELLSVLGYAVRTGIRASRICTDSKVNLKAENIVWMAGLSEDDPRHAKVDAIRRGGENTTEDSGLTYNITEIAQRSRVSRQLVYRAIQTGVLVATPLYPGGRQRIRESDFRHWISARGRGNLGYKKGKVTP